MDRGRPGPAPQTAKREQYAALIARGVSFSEACRMVGTIAGRVSVGDTAEQSPVAAAALCARVARKRQISSRSSRRTSGCG
jgi:hypothetical protein